MLTIWSHVHVNIPSAMLRLPCIDDNRMQPPYIRWQWHHADGSWAPQSCLMAWALYYLRLAPTTWHGLRRASCSSTWCASGTLPGGACSTMSSVRLWIAVCSMFGTHAWYGTHGVLTGTIFVLSPQKCWRTKATTAILICAQRGSTHPKTSIWLPLFRTSAGMFPGTYMSALEILIHHVLAGSDGSILISIGELCTFEPFRRLLIFFA